MASIELRTPKNKPAYYKITASITLNGQTIRKFSRFEFDPKTLKTAKQRVAAATAAASAASAAGIQKSGSANGGAASLYQVSARHAVIRANGVCAEAASTSSTSTRAQIIMDAIIMAPSTDRMTV